jgi:hypothetical protein
MKLAMLLISAAVLLPVRGTAADAGRSAVDPAVRSELTALVGAWIEAEVQSDAEALERILHKDFLSTFASGKTLDRDAYIAFIVSLDIPHFTVRNESMIQHRDTVVVIDVSDDGTTKFSWIAIRRDSRWQVISQTFSRIESSRQE